MRTMTYELRLTKTIKSCALGVLIICLIPSVACAATCNSLSDVQFDNIAYSAKVPGCIAGNCSQGMKLGTIKCTHSLSSNTPSQIDFNNLEQPTCEYRMHCGGAHIIVYTDVGATTIDYPATMKRDGYDKNCAYLQYRNIRVNVANYEYCTTRSTEGHDGLAVFDYRTGQSE